MVQITGKKEEVGIKGPKRLSIEMNCGNYETIA